MWRRSLVIWSTTTDVQARQRAYRVSAEIPEDLQLHAYQGLTDEEITGEQGLGRPIPLIHSRRRYVNEAFHSAKRP